jgi:ankyrin repeat protein
MFNMKYIKKTVAAIAVSVFFMAAEASSSDEFFRAIRQDDASGVIAQALRGVDLNALNDKGEHGLFLALRLGSLKVADFFIEQSGTRLNATTPAGETALMMAALKGHLPQARRLIAQGAEVNKPGWAPLHYAASHTEPISREMVRLLLEHHAYIDAESPNRSTPLMMAAQYGHSSVVPVLLEAGADPLIRNEQGLSAIDFARLAKRSDLAAVIAAHVRHLQPSGRW